MALILGVATRAVALALIPVLLGATWVHAGNGWLFSGTGGGWEFPLFWAIIQLVIALLGGRGLCAAPAGAGTPPWHLRLTASHRPRRQPAGGPPRRKPCPPFKPSRPCGTVSRPRTGCRSSFWATAAR
ncbi:DoxX family protein [Rhodobacter capsulatus]|uniref:DoxX family protein n=1 Tax=Rhodobacter capsulatus TaxID=1061 RepID=UPI0040296D74